MWRWLARITTSVALGLFVSFLLAGVLILIGGVVLIYFWDQG